MGFEDIVDSPYGEAEALGGDDDDDQDLVLAEEGGNPEDTAFDAKVGALNEIVISDEFTSLMDSFVKENCHHFEDTDENKLIYMDLFRQYSDRIETSLVRLMSEALPGFDMVAFVAEIAARQDEVECEVFDMLVSMSDFDSFKQQMLDAKAAAEGSLDLTVPSSPSRLHRDEVMDGEERGDLGDLLSVTPLTPSKKASR